MNHTHARTSFVPNRQDVAAKVIDGELIVIRLSDGTYYSTADVGASIWQMLEGGTSVDAIAETLASRSGHPLEVVAADVRRLVDELLAENLIVPAPASEAPADRALLAAAAPDTYDTPRLNIYRDMGNLLALDPPTPGIDDLLPRAR